MIVNFTLKVGFHHENGIVKNIIAIIIGVWVIVNKYNITSENNNLKQDHPHAIIACVASGGSLATFLPTFGQGILAGLTIDVEELAPAFALAGSGATIGEVVSMLFSILGVGLGIGVVFGLAA